MNKTPPSTEFKIENGVPIPQHVHGNTKYPLAQLGVGDSFFVATANPKKARSVVCAAAAHAKKSGGKLTTSQSPDGIRVWRIA